MAPDASLWARLLLQGANSLCASTAPIQQRLREAHILVVVLEDQAFPAGLLGDWTALRDRFAALQVDNPNGYPQAFVTDDETATTLATDYIGFLFSLATSG